jgi:xanthine permease XanP
MTPGKGGLLYGADDAPPLPALVLSAFQHIGLATTSLAYQVALAREAGLTFSQTLDFISVGLLALGIGTILMSTKSKFVGSGYLCPAGITPVYFGPAVFALQRGGTALLFGMTMVAGLVQIALAPLIRRLRALLPTEIAGLVIAAIGSRSGILRPAPRSGDLEGAWNTAFLRHRFRHHAADHGGVEYLD